MTKGMYSDVVSHYLYECFVERDGIGPQDHSLTNVLYLTLFGTFSSNFHIQCAKASCVGGGTCNEN